ncbi:MAG: chlorite dismutase family protein [Mycobacterium sp.]
MPLPLTTYLAGASGPWRIDSITPVIGETLSAAQRLDIVEAPLAEQAGSTWALRGLTSNIRYSTRAELDALAARQEGLGRPQCTRAAFIPIRKASSWWTLAQDERRALLAEQSHHITVGLEYLPAVARRLHHSRDLGEPFDFLTWFEYAPEHSDQFEDLVDRLRRSPEWAHVEREVDVRLSRD